MTSMSAEAEFRKALEDIANRFTPGSTVQPVLLAREVLSRHPEPKPWPSEDDVRRAAGKQPPTGGDVEEVDETGLLVALEQIGALFDDGTDSPLNACIRKARAARAAWQPTADIRALSPASPKPVVGEIVKVLRDTAAELRMFGDDPRLVNHGAGPSQAGNIKADALEDAAAQIASRFGKEGG